MDYKTTFSLATAAVASLAIVLSTGALGACKTTLRGELVQAPDRHKALPQKFLVLGSLKPRETMEPIQGDS